ncbi:MAG: hypothetical protein ACXAB4_09175 [Candidatus Hodarchaeales archaeon]|jgi:hypothetical protein
MYQTQELATADIPRESFSIHDLKATILVYTGVESLALVDEVSEFLEKDPDRFILKLGFSYFVAIGQGNEYHRGFYGPFPVPNDSEHLSFVFSTIVPDQEQLDTRANGESYVLACLFCQKSLVPKFIDRPMLEAVFEEIFAKVRDVKEIDFSLANYLKSVLIDASR